MKHLFSPQTFKGIFSLLILLLVVKVVWFMVEILWLPVSGVEYVEQKSTKALYYRVKLTPNQASVPVERKPKPTAKKPSGSIKNIKLLAIYNALDKTVVTVFYKGKTKVLSKGDEIKGFVLEGAQRDFAIFSKNAKTYYVTLEKVKKGLTGSSYIQQEAKPSSSFRSRSKMPEGDVTDAGDRKIIDKSLFDHYTHNIDDIYKNIGIGEVKAGSKLKGFRITFVRKGSPFAKLGVKRGDVIKSINGQEINSYNAAFEFYKNIQNIENLTLVIQRGKEEMELEYEIN